MFIDNIETLKREKVEKDEKVIGLDNNNRILIQKKIKYKEWILYPSSKLSLQWQIYISIVILYECIVVPY